ncbi:MAG: hypothetical protein K1000chlam2_00009 [Chlamydiae bacterium]|nr:hypothetical protein [Chlamydiota bacterium]
MGKAGLATALGGPVAGLAATKQGQRTLTGGTTRQKDIGLLSPEQQQFLQGLGLPGLGEQAGQAYSDLLQPPSQDLFQRSVVDPAMQQYEQRVLPAIQQRYVDENAGSSSALNQALAQSATDLTTSLGAQEANFYQQGQSNRISALSGLGGLSNQRTFEPHIQEQQGIMGPLMQILAQLGITTAMSSEHVKENIREYKTGLETLKNLDVKMYDFIEQVGGLKDKVGVIAEKVPEEIQTEISGIKAVDLYGLMGIMINSIKDLNKKVEMLEAR